LFIIGHDACHQSYTPHRGLNRLLGRIAMIPSLTPYSLWQVGHNIVHHGYTNLKGVDFVWEPLTRSEFQAFAPGRRAIERIYRSGLGSWLYYFREMWWLRMFFPSQDYISTRRPEFVRDSVFVAVCGILWISALIAVSWVTDQSAWALVGFGFAVPFFVWNAMIGFVVYVHHTHPDIRWHQNKKSWAKSAPFVSTTVHLIFPYGIGGLLHHIMEHTAHHVDMSIPLYKLKSAQRLLEETLPGRVLVQRFSWSWYFDTARRCKLYDFDRDCWTDFKGHQTSQRAEAAG
jgi:omega-6 fatty acid desaturase (delta-12 desaturase)